LKPWTKRKPPARTSFCERAAATPLAQASEQRSQRTLAHIRGQHMLDVPRSSTAVTGSRSPQGSPPRRQSAGIRRVSQPHPGQPRTTALHGTLGNPKIGRGLLIQPAVQQVTRMSRFVTTGTCGVSAPGSPESDSALDRRQQLIVHRTGVGGQATRLHQGLRQHLAGVGARQPQFGRPRRQAHVSD